MGRFTSLCAVVRTRSERYSGTRRRPWLVVNQAGVDRFNREMLSLETVGSYKRGECLYYYQSTPAADLGELRDDLIGPGELYVRLVSTSTDLWRPELALVWARSRDRGTVPLAAEVAIEQPLCAAARKGRPSLPLRRVLPGGDDTPIQRLLLVVVTYDAPYAGTDDPLSLRISADDRIVVDHTVTDTPQTDLEANTANIYHVPVAHPFARGEVRGSAAAVRLGILGSDKWVPKKIFLFGLDRLSGHPERVVPLARVLEPGPLSADPSEGVASIFLPVE